MSKRNGASSRISLDLGDPVWLKLLKQEAHETNSTLKDVLIRALDGYFSNRLESKALLQVSRSTFEEWDNKLDSDYDRQ